MPEVATLTVVASVARMLTPVLNGIYGATKNKVKSRMQGWKAGEDLEKIAEYYVRLASVKTIFSREEAIPIESFYYPSRISFKKECKEVNGLNDLPVGCVVVEGVVGQGKSIFMRHLALSVLADPSVGKIPIFIELRNISKKNSLKDLLWKAFQSIGVNPDDEVISYLAKEQKLVLVLDGFDEIVEDLVSDTLTEIDELKNNNSGLKIVVSSRPQNAIQNVSEFKVVRLQPLRAQDHDAFLMKLGVDSERRVDLVAAIKESSQDIQDAISTPLMMSIVVLVYESVKQIPPYLSDFFSELFHVVFTQHDSLKEAFRRKHHTGLSEDKLQHLFEAFCFVVMQKSYGRTLNTSKFHECFDRALKYVPDVKCSADNFKSDIVGVACLMLEEGVGEITFLHKGILDYFAAAFAKRFKELSESFYASVVPAYKNWKVSLQFLSKIDAHRYLKFYYLVYVAGELKSLTAVLKSSDDAELNDYTARLFERVMFHKSGGSTRIEVYPSSRNELVEAAAKACREVIVAFPVYNTSKGKFQEVAEKGVKHIDIGSSVVFGLDVALELYGSDEVRKALRGIENEFHRSVSLAKKQLKEFEKIDAAIGASFDF